MFNLNQNIMKNMILILSIFFLITECCSEEEAKQQEDIVSENAALYYYFDAGFGTSQCTFVIETESNKIFVPNATFNLSILGALLANVSNDLEPTTPTKSIAVLS